MNIIVISTAVLLCLCVGSDAMRKSRQGGAQSKVTLAEKISRRPVPRSRVQATGVVQRAGKAAQSAGNPAMPTYQDAMMAEILDLPLIPDGMTSIQYQLMDKLDLPFMPSYQQPFVRQTAPQTAQQTVQKTSKTGQQSSQNSQTATQTGQQRGSPFQPQTGPRGLSFNALQRMIMAEQMAERMAENPNFAERMDLAHKMRLARRMGLLPYGM